MAYLVNQTRLASLTINGTDYTSKLVSWEVSDVSAFKNGLISTTGTLILGQVPGASSLEDYDRDNFKRGTPIILNITYPSGVTARHPRGLLYVISTSYEIESGELSVEMGCRLAMAALTEDIDALLPLAPLPLDEAQKTYSNISASFASAGKYLYQNNLGNLVSGSFFDGDSFSGIASGSWVSILSETALSVTSLQSNGAIPDSIELSYNVATEENSDKQGDIQKDTTESYYWLNYPAVVYYRKNTTGTVPVNSATTAPNSGTPTNCGNTPPQPSDSLSSCSENYLTTQQNLTISAKRIQISESHYNGPAAQVSYSKNEVWGPAVEANPQYFSDQYAYCKYRYADKCRPNGNCPTKGLNEVLLSKDETINEFSTDGRVIKTISNSYVTGFSLIEPSEWRSGNSSGTPTDFTPISFNSSLIKVRSQITEYYEEGKTNIQKTTTYESITGNKAGLGDTLAPNKNTTNASGQVTGLSRPTTNPKLRDGAYENLIVTTVTGSGNNMSVRVVSTDSGKARTVESVTESPTMKPLHATTAIGETEVEVDIGAGVGMKVVISRAYYNLVYQWKVISIKEGGSGYNSGEEVGVSYTSLTKAGLSKYVASGSLKFELGDTDDGTILILPEFPGVGYDEGDEVKVQSSALVAKGAGSPQKDLKFTVKESESGAIIKIPGDEVLNAIKTVEVRKSVTISANPLNPDSLNKPTTNTETKTSKLSVFTGRYVETTPESSEYILKESLPSPILSQDPNEVSSIVDAYSDYLVRFTKGNALGMTIGEPLREDIASGWAPNTPFRYYDPFNGKLIAMRMDGTTWGVTGTETGLVTRGIWMGTSNGTVQIPENLVGDSRPDMGSGTVPPVNPNTPPQVNSETAVDSGSYGFDIDVSFGIDLSVTSLVRPYFEGTVTVNINTTNAYTVTGYIVTPGSLLALNADGSMPLEYKGNLLVASATVVDGDLFA